MSILDGMLDDEMKKIWDTILNLTDNDIKALVSTVVDDSQRLSVIYIYKLVSYGRCMILIVICCLLTGPTASTSGECSCTA